MFSQSTVTGVVKDIDGGETLPYASITVKGTKIGTSTNLDGYFTLLRVSGPEIILLVSYVGYVSKEVSLKGLDLTGNITILMESDGSRLDEVVVNPDEEFSCYQIA